MERDFLGLGVIETKESKDEHGRSANKQDAAVGTYGGSPAQWTFGRNAAPIVSFAPAARDARQRELVFDRRPYSGGFDPAAPEAAFNRSHRTAPAPAPAGNVLAPQACVGPVYGGGGAPSYHVSSVRTLPVPSYHMTPLVPANPSNAPPPPARPTGFAGHPAAVASSLDGRNGPRNAPPAKAAQLTIFYAGTVSVFDNVPPEKAQELMISAHKVMVVPRPPPAAVDPMPPPVKHSNAVADVRRVHLAPEPRLALERPTAPTQPGNLSRSSSNAHSADLSGPKSSSAATPSLASSQPAAAATDVIARAVPQARKASLARFLEMRKARTSSAKPYDKINADGGNNLSRSSCLGTPAGDALPSTKLQI